MENLKRFNWLIAQGDSAQLYEFLYSLSVDNLIEVLHTAGFQCGNSTMLKQVILWAINEELASRKLAKQQLAPKVVSAQMFNNFAHRINQTFIAALGLPDKRKTAATAKKMLANLDSLRRVVRVPGEVYAREEYLESIELRICRWLCDYQLKGVSQETSEIPTLHAVFTAQPLKAVG